MDLAGLGLFVDSKPLDAANKKLTEFSGVAGRAEKSADSYNRRLNKMSSEKARATTATQKFTAQLGLANRALGATKVSALAAVSALKGMVIGLGAFLGVGALYKSFLDNTREAEKVQAQLAAALRSTRGASGQTIDSLNEHARALQKVTNFGDEALGTAQSILLTFTKIGGEVFPQATEAVANLATRLGGDLNGAALQIGKALNDPILGMSMLSRAGVQFTQAQKDMAKQMVESNNMLGAQTIILKELEKQFGGSARAARETLGGAITSLANAWGDLFEVSGPASESLRMAVERLITAIQDPAFVAFIQMIGVTLFNALSLVANAFSLLATVIPPVADLLMHLSPLIIAVFGPTVLAMVQTLAATIATTLIGAVSSLFLLIAANPVTAFLATVAVLLGYLVNWQKAISGLIKVWAYFMQLWHSFWGNASSRKYWIEIGVNADDAVADLLGAGEKVKEELMAGISFGAVDAGSKMTKAVADGGDIAAAKIKAGMTDAKVTANYEELNGKFIKPLGDTLMAGGAFIYNQVNGSIRSAAPPSAQTMKMGIEAGGAVAAQTMAAGISGAAGGGGGIGGMVGQLGSMTNTTMTMPDELLVDYIRSVIGVNVMTQHKLQGEARQAEAQAYALRQTPSASQKALYDQRLARINNRSSGSGSFGSDDLGLMPPPIRTEGSSSGNRLGPAMGFAGGGSFTVPGAGGVDSQRVSFMATPGEKVSVGHGDSPPPKVEVKVVNSLDPKMLVDVMTSGDGQQALRNVIRADREELQSILGVSGI